MARVLLVDNNKLVVDLIENYLKDQGYDIDRAYDGLEAIDRVAHQVPDIIVTDLIMPKVDGKKLCRFLRQNPPTSKVPIIVLSGIASEDREGYREVQADAYLAKCAYDKLLPNVKDTLEKLLTRRWDHGNGSIVGIEQIYPRELVKEFTIIKKHYDAILANMAEGVVEVDPSGRVVMVNKAAQEILDRREEELVGTEVSLLFQESVRADVLAEVTPFERGEYGHRSLRTESFGKTLRVRFSPIVREQNLHGVFLTIEDISRQAALEAAERDYTRRLEEEVRNRTQELQHRNEELERANRLKDEFLGVLSHELRTPITPIKGYIELLRDNPGDPALAAKALAVLKRQSDHLERLLTDLLDLTALEAGRIALEVEACEINEVIRTAAERLVPAAAERNIELELDLLPEPLTARADSERLQQVMYNLLANAIKFSREGGHIVARSSRSGDRAQLSVTDRGIGIDSRDQDVIFERFRQIDSSVTRKYSGLGIGLTLAKKLVDMMGGSITVESRPGAGSTFSVTLEAIG